MPITLCALPNPVPVAHCLDFLFLYPPNRAWTFLQNHLNPLLLNLFGIINNYQMQPVFKCHLQICSCTDLVHRSSSKLFKMIQITDTPRKFFLQKRSNSYFLSLIRHNSVRLPSPCGNLLPVDLDWLRAELSCALCTPKARWIISLIIIIIFRVETHSKGYKFTIHAISVCHRSATSCIDLVGSLRGSIPHVLEGGSGRVEHNPIGLLTRQFLGGAGGIWWTQPDDHVAFWAVEGSIWCPP